MQNHLQTIRNCPLFQGIGAGEVQALLGCLCATRKGYEKNQPVFRAGEEVRWVGVVLTGNVHVMQEDFWGNRTILASIGPSGLFGEAFTCAETEKLPVSVLATRPSEILLVDYRRIITSCAPTCAYHAGLIKNMVRILAAKNVMLTQKMELLTRRTTREKLLSFFSAQAQMAGSSHFVIPFNRQELAEYLSVDRSAMSSELSKMRRDGILLVHKSEIQLLKPLEDPA